METSLIGKALGFGSKECRFDSYVSKIKNNCVSLVNSYNIAVKKKSVNIWFNYSTHNLRLLKKLHYLGIINSYILKKNHKRVKFSVTYFHSVPYSSSIRYVSRGVKSFSISLKGLAFLQKFSGASLILIESSSGIITLEESLLKKKSGKLALVIN